MLSTIEQIAPYNTNKLIAAFSGDYCHWLNYMHYSIGYIDDIEYTEEIMWLNSIRCKSEVL